MDVPLDLREMVGRTSWTFSLKTSDPQEAAIKRAYWTAHYKAEVLRLRGLLANKSLQDSREAVGRALAVVATRMKSMDDAIRANLLLITHQARHSWGEGHGRAADSDLGHFSDNPEDEDFAPDPFPGFDDRRARENFVTRLGILEKKGVADGMVYQEIAKGLLERRAWPFVELPLLGLLSFVGIELKIGTPEYDAAAEELLQRLAHHQFSDWKPHIREALSPLGDTSRALPAPEPEAHAAGDVGFASSTASWQNAGKRFHPSQTLSAGLLRWQQVKDPGESAVIEATRAVQRFIHLYGDRCVASITENEVFDYRDFLQTMPAGLSLPTIEASGKTLREAVAEARAREEQEQDRALAAGLPAPSPRRLSPTSVKKDIGGLSAIFAALRGERWISENVAREIPIDGYSRAKKVFPFRPDMMRRLFDSPMFTGCQSERGKKRTLPGPKVIQDTLYWSFLFGATVGHRMSEVAEALTENVEEAVGPSGEKIIGIFIMDAKNEFSQRVLIVHPHLISLGFLDYVRERRERGEAKLFDLPGGGVKKLSEKLNNYIDEVIVDDRRYVFHSLRHEFADRSEIDVGVELSKKIMGHSRGRLYGLGAPLHHAAAELNKIDMSFVDWDRLRAAAGRHRTTAA